MNLSVIILAIKVISKSETDHMINSAYPLNSIIKPEHDFLLNLFFDPLNIKLCVCSINNTNHRVAYPFQTILKSNLEQNSNFFQSIKIIEFAIISWMGRSISKVAMIGGSSKFLFFSREKNNGGCKTRR